MSQRISKVKDNKIYREINWLQKPQMCVHMAMRKQVKECVLQVQGSKKHCSSIQKHDPLYRYIYIDIRHPDNKFQAQKVDR